MSRGSALRRGRPGSLQCRLLGLWLRYVRTMAAIDGSPDGAGGVPPGTPEHRTPCPPSASRRRAEAGALSRSEGATNGACARNALRTGLELQQTIAANPYRFGMIDSSGGDPVIFAEG